MEVSQLRQGLNGSRILLALDGMSLQKAKERQEELGQYVAGFKVNDLIDHVGERALAGSKGLNFYDPKIHDIKNTVTNRLLAYRTHADMVTVHASMKTETLHAAAQVAEACGFACIAVTVLTDMSSEDCVEIYGRQPMEVVRDFVLRARSAGIHGIVCSPKETKMVRDMWRNALIINPGIRLQDGDQHDQARVGTPEQAIKDGADLFVVGRDVMNQETHTGRLQRLLKYQTAINTSLALV